MQKDDRLYVGHMLDLARKACQRVRGKSRDDFDQDENLRIVLTHLVQTIGEAARHVSGEFQREHPEVPWPAIIGMRHKIVHDYLSVDEDRVWRTATEELGELIDQLGALVPER